MSSLVWRFFNILRYWAVTLFFNPLQLTKSQKSEKRIVSGVEKLDTMRFIVERFTSISPKIEFFPASSFILYYKIYYFSSSSFFLKTPNPKPANKVMIPALAKPALASVPVFGNSSLLFVSEVGVFASGVFGVGI